MRRRRRLRAESPLPDVPGGWEQGFAESYRISIERGAPEGEANIWAELQTLRNAPRVRPTTRGGR